MDRDFSRRHFWSRVPRGVARRRTGIRWRRVQFAKCLAVVGTRSECIYRVDAVIERRFAPSYARHFDTAWKQGVQIALAIVFVGLFWGVLYLGASLFKLIEIDFFERLLQRRWFWCPAITLAFAVAIHVTDVQPSLIRGARSLVLTLFSWLLPLLVLILVGFLGSLPFISLAPLWKTGFATSLLLTAAGLLVLLINACYPARRNKRTPELSVSLVR
jgi:hypothetical protein